MGNNSAQHIEKDGEQGDFLPFYLGLPCLHLYFFLYFIAIKEPTYYSENMCFFKEYMGRGLNCWGVCIEAKIKHQ